MDARQDQFTKGTESLPNGENRRIYHEPTAVQYLSRVRFHAQSALDSKPHFGAVAPLITTIYRRPGEATSHRRAAEYPSRRR